MVTGNIRAHKSTLLASLIAGLGDLSNYQRGSPKPEACKNAKPDVAGPKQRKKKAEEKRARKNRRNLQHG